MSLKTTIQKNKGKVALILLAWVAVSWGLSVIAGPHERALEVEVFAPKSALLGYPLSVSIFTAWEVIAAISALAVAFRLLGFPRFKEVPGRLQNAVEIAVDAARSYTRSKVHGLSDALCCYIFTIGAFLVGCAAVELFGIRTPTADLVTTFSLSIITFVMINYFGIKVKRLSGRLRSMAQPTPVIFPIRLITDIAVPVSLACRLFGNMLGGMIVMELLYYALGYFSIGAPAFLGLYFNLFHPLIQAYIFITLTLTFISEAVE